MQDRLCFCVTSETQFGEFRSTNKAACVASKEQQYDKQEKDRERENLYWQHKGCKCVHNFAQAFKPPINKRALQ